MDRWLKQNDGLQTQILTYTIPLQKMMESANLDTQWFALFYAFEESFHNFN